MARFLLDTHTFLWWLWDSPQLGPTTRSALSNPGNQIFVSALSLYEISYKSTWGNLDAPENLEEIVDNSRFSQLPLSLSHAVQAGRLSNYHRDPFDRMLAAQAMVDGLILITEDSKIRSFSVPTLAARH